MRCAIHPDGRGNKPFHQETLGGADIRFVERYARLAQKLFIAHQLTMGATVKAVYRLTVEIFQLKRGDAPAVFAAQ